MEKVAKAVCSLQIPLGMWNAIWAAVDDGKYTSFSEYVREAVRTKMRKEGIKV